MLSLCSSLARSSLSASALSAARPLPAARLSVRSLSSLLTPPAPPPLLAPPPPSLPRSFCSRSSSSPFASRSFSSNPPNPPSGTPGSASTSASSTDTDYRDLKLSADELVRVDGGIGSKRKRTKKKRPEENVTPTQSYGDLTAERLSEEETERLLAEAHAAIPQRSGAQNFNRKRRFNQKNIWIRKQHRRQKFERIRAHEKRMLNRKRIADECRAMRELAYKLYPDHPNNAHLKRKLGAEAEAEAE
ncbi:hypothetical protein TeGR_g9824 [Tetraparma gracilis]|uniref:Mitochondrial mRNA-processing protein COX24 C-terminal domain-containing protein n=1 Tax=Tetraparma gracilis TaxID=2962635 RepID=A0ABQ6N2M1_9STRA|nr:hypothetical protein TeGR_g9824 [Tetraparma gracilis]